MSTWSRPSWWSIMSFEALTAQGMSPISARIEARLVTALPPASPPSRSLVAAPPVEEAMPEGLVEVEVVENPHRLLEHPLDVMAASRVPQ